MGAGLHFATGWPFQTRCVPQPTSSSLRLPPPLFSSPLLPPQRASCCGRHINRHPPRPRHPESRPAIPTMGLVLGLSCVRYVS